MKLPIKKEYFDKIKSGEKNVEYREAHITFVCEETGEELRRDVVYCEVITKYDLPLELQNKPFLKGYWFIKSGLQ